MSGDAAGLCIAAGAGLLAGTLVRSGLEHSTSRGAARIVAFVIGLGVALLAGAFLIGGGR